MLWVVLASLDDITQLDVLSGVNAFLNGQSVDPLQFPAYHAIFSTRSVFSPELLPANSSLFGAQGIIECGASWLKLFYMPLNLIRVFWFLRHDSN